MIRLSSTNEIEGYEQLFAAFSQVNVGVIASADGQMIEATPNGYQKSNPDAPKNEAPDRLTEHDRLLLAQRARGSWTGAAESSVGVVRRLRSEWE